MNKITIKKLSDYCSIVLENFSNSKSVYFRGYKDKEYRLIPSLGRKVDGENIYRIDEERKIIEEAFNLLPSVFNKSFSPIQLLSLLQHYGIPTRLLDVTTNPLVALYFACEDDNDKIGEIIVFEEEKINLSDYGMYNAIADSYELCVDNALQLSEFFSRAIMQPYLANNKRNLKRYKKSNGKSGYIKTLLEKRIFIAAPYIAERQRFQQGAYILFPNIISKNNKGEYIFINEIEEIPKTDRCINTIINIPPNSKKQILKDLQMLGIDKSRIYGDSIDSVCQNIKKKFEIN